MRDEEETAQWRQRSGRLQRWRELVAEASAENQVKVAIPDGLQHMGLSLMMFCLFRSYYQQTCAIICNNDF